MKIENIELNMEKHFLNPVTYVPVYAKGNAGHPDCEQGVIISFNDEANTVKVLYFPGRTVQATHPENLVWG